MTKQPDKEPVLLVPPVLTKSSYAILLEHNCVGRTWHHEGRYGSRTHEVKGTGKMGLPLLKSGGKVDFILRLIEERNGKQNLVTAGGGDNVNDGNKYIQVGAKDIHTSLRELIFTPGVELIFETPVKSNREPKVERFDATTHPELMCASFPLKMKEFLKSRIITHGEDSYSMAPSRTCSEWTEKTPPSAFTFCELFSGIGGFAVALEKLGGTCVFASEIYEPSKRVFCANFDVTGMPGECVSGDIWNIKSKDIPHHDILVAGFPCQPFSNLGLQPGLSDSKTISGRKFGDNQNAACHTDQDGVKNKSGDSGGRGQLFTQIVRVLKDCKPKAFLLENVPGLLTTPYKNGTAWQEIKRSLQSAGYSVFMEVVSSRGMTAQARKRLYIVGILEQSNDVGRVESSMKTRMSTPFQFPFMPDLGLRAADVLHTSEELYNTSLISATGLPESLVRIIQQSHQLPRSPAALFQISDSQLDQLRNRSKAWKPAKLAWGDKTLDTIDSHYGVTVGKGNSQLVPSPAPHHPRRFTPRECARIMGFGNNFTLGEFDEKRFSSHHSDDARFNGFIKEQYYMLGNAVCPPIISVIAGAILDQVLEDDEDWIDRGLWTGIMLSMDAISHSQIDTVCERLLSSFSE